MVNPSKKKILFRKSSFFHCWLCNPLSKKNTAHANTLQCGLLDRAAVTFSLFSHFSNDRKSSSKTKIQVWIPLENTVLFRWYVTLLKLKESLKYTWNEERVAFCREKFLKISTIQFPRQRLIKKYWKLAIMFRREVCYIFQIWSCKRQLLSCFDVKKWGIGLWEQSLKRNDVKQDFIRLH